MDPLKTLFNSQFYPQKLEKAVEPTIEPTIPIKVAAETISVTPELQAAAPEKTSSLPLVAAVSSVAAVVVVAVAGYWWSQRGQELPPPVCPLEPADTISSTPSFTVSPTPSISPSATVSVKPDACSLEGSNVMEQAVACLSAKSSNCTKIIGQAFKTFKVKVEAAKYLSSTEQSCQSIAKNAVPIFLKMNDMKGAFNFAGECIGKTDETCQYIVKNTVPDLLQHPYIEQNSGMASHLIISFAVNCTQHDDPASAEVSDKAVSWLLALDATHGLANANSFIGKAAGAPGASYEAVLNSIPKQANSLVAMHGDACNKSVNPNGMGEAGLKCREVSERIVEFANYCTDAKKCSGFLNYIRIPFISHHLNNVKEIGKKVLWLDDGDKS